MSVLLLSLVLPAWAADPPAGEGSQAGDPEATDPDAPKGEEPDDPKDEAEDSEDDVEDSEEDDAEDSEEDDAEDSEEDDAEDSEEDGAEDSEEDGAEDSEEDDAEDDSPPTGTPLRDVRGSGPSRGIPVGVKVEVMPRSERMKRHRRARAERRATRGTMLPYGQLQVFTTLWDQDEDVQADPASYGDNEADPGFQLARARFGFRGRLPGRPDSRSRIDYALMVGVGTPFDALRIGTRDVGMVDAFLRYNVRTGIGPTSVALGLAKVPFSREALMSSADLAFMERAVGPENLTSVRDVGATASQAIVFGDGDDSPQILVRGGVYNGNADLLGDTDPGLMYAGRIELVKGETYKTWDPDGGVSYGIGGAALYNDGLATNTVAWNADGLVRLGPWSLMAELGQATLTPTDVTVGAPEVVTQTTRRSWVVATSVWLGIDDEQGVEIAARASGFDDNARLSDNGDVLIVHGGAVWRNVLPFLDFGATYIHREELQGTAISNDTIRLYTQIRPAR